MFGFGRRKCTWAVMWPQWYLCLLTIFPAGLGINYAFQYMSTTCATSLVMLDISKATDESGAVLEPEHEMDDRVIK